jgi:hypothetical protein
MTCFQNPYLRASWHPFTEKNVSIFIVFKVVYVYRSPVSGFGCQDIKCVVLQNTHMLIYDQVTSETEIRNEN